MQRGEIPPSLKNIPKLSQLEFQYFQAFEFMAPAKNTGLGRRLIPISEYSAYAQLFSLPEDVETWSRVVRSIDVELTNSDNKNSKSKVQQQTAKQRV